jgi:hypothetical protein
VRHIASLLALTLACFIMVSGCGVQTIEPGKAVMLGPLAVTVSRVTEVDAIVRGVDNVTEMPEEGSFVIVEWQAENTADRDLILVEPALRNQGGQYFYSEARSLFDRFEIYEIDPFSSRFRPHEAKDTLLGVYDVRGGRDGKYEIVFADPFEDSNIVDTSKDQAKPIFYRLPPPTEKQIAVPGENGFTYE